MGLEISYQTVAQSCPWGPYNKPYDLPSFKIKFKSVHSFSFGVPLDPILLDPNKKYIIELFSGPNGDTGYPLIQFTIGAEVKKFCPRMALPNGLIVKGASELKVTDVVFSGGNLLVLILEEDT